MLQMHVRVKVMPEGEQAAKLRLRFSGGLGSALLLLLIELGGLYAFVWSIWSVAAGAWTWFVAAALFGILVPVLLVLALRSTAAHDIRELTDWVAGLVDGTGPGSGVGDKQGDDDDPEGGADRDHKAPVEREVVGPGRSQALDPGAGAKGQG